MTETVSVDTTPGVVQVCPVTVDVSADASVGRVDLSLGQPSSVTVAVGEAASSLLEARPVEAVIVEIAGRGPRGLGSDPVYPGRPDSTLTYSAVTGYLSRVD